MDLEQLKIAAEKSFEKISGSSLFMGICSEHFKKDPICLIQLSLAILLDKPLFLLIQKGAVVPKKLIRLLDGYEFYEKENINSFVKASDKLFLKVERNIQRQNENK